jgi:hypothetical protein
MREFDALTGYPEPVEPRLVSPELRTIKHRIVAAYRDREFYDGDRNFGYGGFNYDGRWVPIAQNMCREYGLDGTSTVLQVGAEKGFLLHDFLQVAPGVKVRGTETSNYAIENAMDDVKPFIAEAAYTELPYADGEFDLVLALGPIYTLSLADAILCLKEIQRVSRGKGFITLGSYRDEDDYWLFKHWTVLGATILKPEEWVEVLEHAGYTGDYKFTGAKSLKLEWAEGVARV